MRNSFQHYQAFEKAQSERYWLVHKGDGPVLATAVHAGHHIREELLPYLEADAKMRRRDEDPLTNYLATAGDNIFISYRSRFEVDLNRPRGKGCATEPRDTWGIKIWKEPPPAEMLERSLSLHDLFYELMREWLDELLTRHRNVLILDLHSYNHRREGPHSSPAPQSDNPDIDLGVTTADRNRFGNVIDVLRNTLAGRPAAGQALDVRENVRYPDGGHWPEWIYNNYGRSICTVTLEYKKTFVDEWSGRTSLPLLEDLRSGLSEAITHARNELLQA